MSRLFDDASSEYLEHAAAVVSGAPLTLACWFRSDSLTIGQTLVSVDNDGAGTNYISLNAQGNVASDPVRMVANSAGGSQDSAATSSGYSANTWHHALGTYSGSELVAYLNGANSGSTASTHSPTLTRTGIGRQYNNTSRINFMSGRIAEAAVWDAVLTAAEAAILADGYSPLFVRPANLVAYWPLIGRTSPEIDSVGGFGMTVTGATQAEHSRIIYPAATPLVAVAEAAAPGSTGPFDPPIFHPPIFGRRRVA